MFGVDVEKAIEMAITLVREAFNNHKLAELTKAKVRHEVENRLELEGGALDEKPYKKRINEAVDKTVEQMKATKNDTRSIKNNSKEAKRPSSSGKERVSSSNDTPSKQSKPISSDAAGPHQLGTIANGASHPTSKSSPKIKKGNSSSNNKKSSKKASESVPSDKKKSKKDEESFKSKERIESDDEDDLKSKELPSASSKKDGKRPIISEFEDETELSTSPKRRRKSADNSSKSKEKVEPGTAKSTMNSPERKNIDEDGSKSDSELSVLIDEPPIKKKEEPKKKSRESEKKSRSKKKAKEVSPHEEQIKKLKSLIVACGVRKVWSKELKGCETPSSQIAHLRKLLTDLGMKGRFSLEQAKAIKAKRDLEREMADVQEFAMKFAGDRPKRAKRKSVEEDESSDVDKEEDEDEEDARPARRPKTAHQSIMAFLGDQSDSE